MLRVGLIADTHGLMRAGALAALEGVDVILHAGDVGGESVLRELRAIAPVHAVYGNTDVVSPELPASQRLTLGGLEIHVSHGHELGSPRPQALAARYDADVIVYGHTHKPLIERVGRALVVNPGAAGPRRFKLQPTVAILEIAKGTATARIISLQED